MQMEDQVTQLMTKARDHRAAPVEEATPDRHVSQGAKRVLTMSTISFTLMFAVWLMFGILGVPIQKELGLSDPQLAWITAVAVLNGSLWRLPAGMLTDRVGGRVVTVAMLLLTAIPCFLITQATSYLPLLALAFLVGFAGNLFSVGISWNAAWFPKDRQGFALGVFGAGNIGASVTKLLIVLLPTIIAGTAGATYLGIFPGGWRIFPAFYTRGPGRGRGPHPRRRAAPRPPGRRRQAGARDARPAAATCGCGVSASTTQPSSAPTWRWPRGCRSTTSTTSTSPWPRPRCSARRSSSRHPCCARSVAGSPTAGAPAGSCTGPSP